jgi:motility quorum-sensing regulator / GCU-specific mRNA interferase toxin
MEKKTPHFKLPRIQSLLQEEKVRATKTALTGGAALGLRFAEIIGVVKALTIADFYKSMTSHADNTIWQDVYRPNTKVGDARGYWRLLPSVW